MENSDVKSVSIDEVAREKLQPKVVAAIDEVKIVKVRRFILEIDDEEVVVGARIAKRTIKRFVGFVAAIWLTVDRILKLMH